MRSVCLSRKDPRAVISLIVPYLEPEHMATHSCKGGWEIYSQVKIRVSVMTDTEREWILGND